MDDLFLEANMGDCECEDCKCKRKAKHRVGTSEGHTVPLCKKCYDKGHMQMEDYD